MEPFATATALALAAVAALWALYLLTEHTTRVGVR